MEQPSRSNWTLRALRLSYRRMNSVRRYAVVAGAGVSGRATSPVRIWYSKSCAVVSDTVRAGACVVAWTRSVAKYCYTRTIARHTEISL